MEEPDHEPKRVEQPYLDSMYRARLRFLKPFYQPFDVQVGNKRLKSVFLNLCLEVTADGSPYNFLAHIM